MKTDACTVYRILVQLVYIFIFYAILVFVYYYAGNYKYYLLEVIVNAIHLPLNDFRTMMYFTVERFCKIKIRNTLWFIISFIAVG